VFFPDRRLVFSLLCCGLLLSACETAPDLPPATYVEPTKDGSAIVYLYRDKTMPTARAVNIKVDDVQIGVLPTDSFTWIRVKPGERQLSVGMQTLIDLYGKAKQQFEADTVYVFKYVSSEGGMDIPVFGAGGAFAGTTSAGGRAWTRLFPEPASSVTKIIGTHKFVLAKPAN
jgi:hypothetical protein